MDIQIKKNEYTGKIEYISTPSKTITSLDELIFNEKEIKPTDMITKGMWNYLCYSLIDARARIDHLEKEIELLKKKRKA